MRIHVVTHKEVSRIKNIFIPLFQKESPEKEEFFSFLDTRIKKAVVEASGSLRSEEGQIKPVWADGVSLVFFGLGEKSKWNYRKEQLIARRYVRYARAEKISEFAALLPRYQGKKKDSACIFATNALMADFEFNAYKQKPPEGWPEIKTIYLAADQKDFKEIKEGLTDGLIIGEEVNTCRALANTPGGDMTPARLAEAALRVARQNKIKIKILGDKEMKRLRMGAILGVAQGSSEKPRFIVIEYFKGPKNQKPLVLAGKGVTFDTGGLNIKPDSAILEMHMDMSGGAAVIHGIAAAARLNLPVNIVGLIPAVENMPSGSSYRPGDILKTMSGKTIEVLNTDAEGRIILSDALWYGVKNYQPGFMVDFATLTGAAHVALGNYCSAIFTNREEIQEKLIAIGKESGDYVWPLPLWDEYLPEIKGTFGDIANMGAKDRWGGAIHGAKFLEQFVDNTPWAHVDIAPRMTAVEGDYLARGATGVGVRYIVELAKNYPTLL